MYCDWIYPWCLMSYANVSSGLIIILKASLEWAPLVGPVRHGFFLFKRSPELLLIVTLTLGAGQAMQLFHFCFIGKDRPLTESNLFSTALWRRNRNEPYQCLLFPEGTLYSGQTQPRSAAFAEKLGIVSTPFFRSVDSICDSRLTRATRLLRSPTRSTFCSLAPPVSSTPSGVSAPSLVATTSPSTT